jgi:hypothetical protein
MIITESPTIIMILSILRLGELGLVKSVLFVL